MIGELFSFHLCWSTFLLFLTRQSVKVSAQEFVRHKCMWMMFFTYSLWNVYSNAHVINSEFSASGPFLVYM